MSIRQGLLALLLDGPQYGYQLRADFEQRTGSIWPLNVGQVYTTLARLERDRLVESDGSDDEGRVRYLLLDAGRDEVAGWFAAPVPRESRPRDELAIKLALAVSTPGVDVARVIQAQRTDSLRALQDYTRLKRRADPGQLAWLLVLESMVFQTEGEVRWLDHCEAMVSRHGVRSRAAAPTGTPTPSAVDEADLGARLATSTRTEGDR